MRAIGKVCVLGGSSINTPELIDALEAEQLEAQEIALVSRSADKLATVRGFCERRANELGVATRVTATNEVDAGLRDASFVLNMIRVGGSNVWSRCKHIMLAYGLGGQALFHPGAISNLQTVLDYAEAIQRVCPDTWLVEFTNPCGLHLDAMSHRVQDLRAISGCNAPLVTRQRIAELLGEEMPQDARSAGTRVGGVEIHWYGLNHCAWVTDVTIDGTSVLHKMVERNAALDEPVWDVNQIERLGVVPVAAAADLLRASQETRRPPPDAAEQAAAFVDDSDEREAHVLSLYADEAVPTEHALEEKGRFGSYHSAIVPIVAGLVGDEPRRYYSAWPTAEALPDFPGSHVECALTLVSDAATPTFAPRPLPSEVIAACRRAHESEQLVVEAATTHSLARFVEALATHPTCGSLEYAEAVVSALRRHVELPLS